MKVGWTQEKQTTHERTQMPHCTLHKTTDRGGGFLCTHAHITPHRALEIQPPLHTTHTCTPPSCTILTQEGTREDHTQETTRAVGSERASGRRQGTPPGPPLGRPLGWALNCQRISQTSQRYNTHPPSIIPLRTLSRKLPLLSLILLCWFHGRQTTKLRQYEYELVLALEPGAP